ncbi:MAG: signal peptidase I [Elusimicrobiota bacterium]|nr:signal peptidase I [Endomicrobiia bacterium]MDW8166155.1 signal peptidase I [Elusimicrobiota bacterium]
MIFFEMMPMEGKLIVIGFVFLLWFFLYKKINPKPTDKNYLKKFSLLHTLLGFPMGLVVGLVVSTFTGNIESQTNYSLIFGLILSIIFFIYSKLKKENIQKTLESDLDWGETGWFTLFVVAVIMYCFIQAFKIPTGSMRMTLVEGDYLFVNKFIYGIKIPFTNIRILQIKKINRGDIVVFECPPEALSLEERKKKIQKDFIKRCVAVAGDKVEIRDKILYINDIKIEEPYVNFEDPDNIYQTQKFYDNLEEYQRAWEEGRFTELPPFFIRDNFGPVIVPPGCYFVLGDNRDKSFDSRFWGPLEEKYIKGAPLIVYWPPTRIRIPK